MFYVYVYRDPRPTKNRQAVYVGKGRGKRAWKHWLHGNKTNKSFNNWLAHIRRLSLSPVVEIVAQFESETVALDKERELIALFGRRDIGTGSLFNLTLGGQGTSGALRTEEWRNNIRAALTTPEQVAKSSARNKARWADPDIRAELEEKIRAAIYDPEIAAKREAAKAISHRTPEFREKMSGVTSGFWQDPDYRERVNATRRATMATDVARARKAIASANSWADPESREKRIAAIKASRTPELRAQIGASCKALWSDEKRAEQSAKMKAVLASPEARERRAEAMRARWADPGQRERLRAAISKPHKKNR